MAIYEFPRPIATVDVVLFTLKEAPIGKGRNAVTEKRVHVVLAPRVSEPYVGALAIPGTYVHMDADEDLDGAAVRVLREKCGLANASSALRRDSELYVEQLKTYSGRGRDPRDWSITTAYYALVPPHVLEAAGATLALVPADGLKGLPFDHDRIVADGLERIRGKATYTTLPAKMLPKAFTLRELEEVYEAVLGRQVYTASFRRKISGLTAKVRGRELPWIVQTAETQRIDGRPAALYEKSTNELVVFPQRF